MILNALHLSFAAVLLHTSVQSLLSTEGHPLDCTCLLPRGVMANLSRKSGRITLTALAKALGVMSHSPTVNTPREFLFDSSTRSLLRRWNV